MAKRQTKKGREATAGKRQRAVKVLHVFHWQERYERESWQEGMPFIKHIIGSGAGSTEANQFLGQLKELRALVGDRYHHIRSIYYDIAGLAASAQAGYRGYLLNECFGPLEDRRLAARIELSLAETEEALKALLAVNLLERVELPDFGETATRTPKKARDDQDDPARTKRAQSDVIDSKCAQSDANDPYRAQAFANGALQDGSETAKNPSGGPKNADLKGESGPSDGAHDVPKSAPPLSTKTKGQVQTQDQASAGADECQSSKRANTNGQDGQGQVQGESQDQAEGPGPSPTATSPTTAPPGVPWPVEPQGVTARESRGQAAAEPVVRTPSRVRLHAPGDAWSIGAVIAGIEHRYNLQALSFADEIFALLMPPFDRDSREGRRELGNFAAAFQEAIDAGLSPSALAELVSRARGDAREIAKHRARHYRDGGSPERYWRFQFNQHLNARRGPPR
jgi:hypothetical protein